MDTDQLNQTQLPDNEYSNIRDEAAFTVTYSIAKNVKNFRFGVYAYDRNDAATGRTITDYYFGIRCSSTNPLAGASLKISAINAVEPDHHLLAIASRVREVIVPDGSLLAAGVGMSDVVLSESMWAHSYRDLNGDYFLRTN